MFTSGVFNVDTTVHTQIQHSDLHRIQIKKGRIIKLAIKHFKCNNGMLNCYFYHITNSSKFDKLNIRAVNTGASDRYHR